MLWDDKGGLFLSFEDSEASSTSVMNFTRFFEAYDSLVDDKTFCLDENI